MAIVLYVDFETGDTSQFDWVTDIDGDMVVNVASALAGTTKGIECTIDDLNAFWGNNTLSKSEKFRYRLHIDPNSLSMEDGEEVTFFQIFQRNTGIYSPKSIHELRLHYIKGIGYYIASHTYEDDNTDITDKYEIVDNEHCVEALLERASGDGLSDGGIQWWVDDFEVSDTNDLTNYNRMWGYDWTTKFGVVNTDPSTSGSIYLDELLGVNSGLAIGCSDESSSSTSTSSSTTSSSSSSATEPGITESSSSSSSTSSTSTSSSTSSTSSSSTSVSSSSSSASSSSSSTSVSSSSSSTSVSITLPPTYNKPSYYRTFTISVNVYTPLIQGGNYIKTLDEELSSYSHTISVDGGFDTASISINIPPPLTDDWLEKGIGRHIVAHGAGGEIVWEGFVNNVSVNMGNITIERGRLTDLCNRCMVVYTPIIDPDANPPTTGTTTETLIAEDEDSQRIYGIWEKVVSGGTALPENADYIRDTFLEENKNLQLTHHPVIGQTGGDVTVSLECRGYKEFLSYVYNYLSDPALSIEASEKIIDILEADPNDVISSDMHYINYNGVLVLDYEDQNRPAIEVINETVGFGDINYLRWVFGIYEDRKAHYRAIPETIEYLHYIATESQKILNLHNAEISLWNVRPGKICVIPDTIIGQEPMYTGVRTDPRVMFIESVTYTAPGSIDLQGRKIRNLDQLLAQLGVSGR